MKKAIVVALFLLMLGGTLVSLGQSGAPSNFKFVSGIVLVQDGDSFAPKLLNISQSTQQVQILIYQTFQPRMLVADSGVVDLLPGRKVGLSVGVAVGAVSTFSVDIFTTSDEVIPSVRVGTACVVVPCRATELLHGSQLTKFKVVFP